MRTLRLARVAAQAEILLLRRMLAAAVRHAIFGAVAAVFTIAVVVLLHVLIVDVLEGPLGLSPLLSVAIVLVLDLIAAAVFGMLALGKIEDPVATEARFVRDTSLEQARQSLTVAALLAPTTRIVAQTGMIGFIAEMIGLRRRRS